MIIPFYSLPWCTGSTTGYDGDDQAQLRTFELNRIHLSRFKRLQLGKKSVGLRLRRLMTLSQVWSICFVLVRICASEVVWHCVCVCAQRWPSRLTALVIFARHEECQMLIAIWGWPVFYRDGDRVLKQQRLNVQKTSVTRRTSRRRVRSGWNSLQGKSRVSAHVTVFLTAFYIRLFTWSSTYSVLQH